MSALIERAVQIERAGMDADARIENSEGASVSADAAIGVYANSHGFVGSGRSTRFDQSCVLVARDDSGMQRDWDWDDQGRFEALSDPGKTGRRAAERAVRRLGARAAPSGRAPVLFDNLRAAMQGRDPGRSFKPQGDYLKLVSTGAKRAVGVKFGLVAKGGPVWSLKDRIDRRFMQKLSDVEPMAPERLKGARAAGVDDLHGGQPLCGGCGAKTARAPLFEGLADLPAPQRTDIVAGRGDDAAMLAFGDRVQVLSTDHLRAFVDDPYLFARIAAVHALGDVWACGASAQSGLVQLTLPPMREAMQAGVLKDVLAGAQSVFGPEGADIVGGHTSTGAEFTLGFSVTGLAARAVRQGGAKPGDVLILTKPIGSGVLLAGEMTLKAGGRAVAACWESMARPQGEAARQLAEDARAMTDVTGFGLAGHLLSLLGEDSCAMLDLSALPVLDGAEALAEAGVRSTLFEANRLGKIELNAPTGARADLLLDPQTAGGLLAAVPEDAAERRLEALHAANEPAWIIGWIETRRDGCARVRAR
ncbi:MAG: selenide, water dikinase SelD, partial [Oceanicaulis sp.]